MSWDVGNRVGALGCLAIVLIVGGCKPWEPDTEPPARTQMVCAQQGAPASAPRLVFILDTGRDEVIWANGPNAPKGRLEVTDYVYRFDFPRTAKAHASAARVTRFDGVMEREFGSSPFLAEGPIKRGNVRQTWSCEPKPQAPKV